MISTQLKNRIILLSKTKMMIDECIVYINFLHSPLNELISMLNKSNVYNEVIFIDKCKSLLDEDIDFPIAWKTAVNDTNSLYKKKEKEKLLEMADVLGKGDVSGQISMLKLYSECFDKFCALAQETAKKYSGMFIVSFTFIGCLLFILLL